MCLDKVELAVMTIATITTTTTTNTIYRRHNFLRYFMNFFTMYSLEIYMPYRDSTRVSR